MRPSFLEMVRRVSGRDDASLALANERRRLSASAMPPSVGTPFREEMVRLAGTEDRIVLGRAARDPSLEVSLPVATLGGLEHGLILGGTGMGKSTLVAWLGWSLLRRIAAGESRGFAVTDEKGELVRDYLSPIFLQLLRELPEREAQRFADQLVILDPFSKTSLVPLNILEPISGVPAAVQAFDVAALIERSAGAAFGVLQDRWVQMALLLAIEEGWSLTDLLYVLNDTTTLAARAASSPSREVREFFAADRITRAAAEGVRARVGVVTRLPAARLMVGSRRRSPSISDILKNKILFVTMGTPPLGAEAVQRFFSALFVQRITQAIFDRTKEDRARPLTLVMDEFTEGLMGSPDASAQTTRLLQLARSRSVSIVLATQSMATVSQLSQTLPKVIATNVGVSVAFRCNREDAESQKHLFEVSGRRRRTAPEPWEPAPKSPFLSPNEELQELVKELTALPRRHFYYWNRSISPHAELVVANTIEIPKVRFAPRWMRERVQDGVLGIPIATLDAEARARENEQAVAPTPTPPTTAAGQLRARRPRARRAP
ncbi:MAG: type IV secretion system DNA-binding domain-containing protein [Polyangiales bacterium]